MTSIVIAAHNEGRTVGRCLDALLADGAVGPFEVVVAANGCSDDTVRAATRPGVVVIDLPQAGKAAAINAAERVMRSFPRVYLDADCILTADDVARLAAAVDDDASQQSSRPLAATARRVIDTAGRPFVVRHYYRTLDRHPAFTHSLFGRGVVALSKAGRARFDEFPGILADDFFLDSLFAGGEKHVVSDVVSVVGAPSTSKVLVQRLARVRRGNREVRRSGTAVLARRVEGFGWLLDAVRATPTLAPSAAVYAAVTAYVVVSSRLTRVTWGHDRGRPLKSADVGVSVG